MGEAEMCSEFMQHLIQPSQLPSEIGAFPLLFPERNRSSYSLPASFSGTQLIHGGRDSDSILFTSESRQG